MGRNIAPQSVPPIPDWARNHLAAQIEQRQGKPTGKPPGKPKPSPAPIAAAQAAPVAASPIDAAAQSLARAFGGGVIQLDSPIEDADPPARRTGARAATTATATKLRIREGDPVDLWLPLTQRWVVAGMYFERSTDGHAQLGGGRGPLAVPISQIRRSLAAPD